MASNEHAYLSEGNLHNPKGFSTATNDTLCSKDVSANLIWEAKSEIKVIKPSFSGYCTLLQNYQYPEPQVYGQSPYDINQDYGSVTISAATTVVQKKFYRIGNFIADQACTLQQAYVQISDPDGGLEVTVALVKYTPTDGSPNAYPVSLFEQPTTPLGNDNLVSSYSVDMTDVAVVLNVDVAQGDHLFLMIKSDDVGTNPAYISVAIELGYTN